MYCTKCGTKFADDAKFCSSCGSPRPVIKREELIIGQKPQVYENKQEIASNITKQVVEGHLEETRQEPESTGKQTEVRELDGQVHNGNVVPSNQQQKDVEKSLPIIENDIALLEEAPMKKESPAVSELAAAAFYGNTPAAAQDPFAAEKEPVDERTEALKVFIGKNVDYYFQKWNVSSDVVNKSSWNWAAFFLNLFWAGYRKMYGLIGIFILVWLVLDGIIYSLGINSPAIDSAIGIATAVIFGFCGNYYYYLHANRKLMKYKDPNGTYYNQFLQIKGGTSGLGVVISIVGVVAYSFISISILYSALVTETVAFGYGENAGYLTEQADEFSVDDEIYYSFYFPDNRGGEFKVMIEKVENGVTVYDSWYDEIPPDWPGLISSMYAPQEEGEYVMKIIRDNDIVAEGTFYITGQIGNVDSYEF
ncbi:DUF2628 domain-containing protein [Caldibacillus lycopersici]|uniref:DUF2628 domain-containing protein n=1 Tax=Perspicuibacillus lycopersici TaxID=1325689 RepID=A0AAE3IYF1_9BACI|nr:DUF2628 domain-containing protein [Perspicuibacillus lycopersici]MCU9614340.1 DUF2628 domain-containing protein [Perspicuibacillus lycopersici]